MIRFGYTGPISCTILIYLVFISNALAYHIVQLTDTTTTEMVFDLQLTDSGFAVWHDMSRLFLYDGATLTQLAENDSYISRTSVNALGQVAWSAIAGNSGYEIFFYDGSHTVQLSDNDRHDRLVGISDCGHVIWSARDGADRRDLFLFDGTKTIQIASYQITGTWQDGDFIVTHVDFPAISASGHVVYSAYDGSDMEIFLYNGTDTIQLSDNDFGDMFPIVNSSGHVLWRGIVDTEDRGWYSKGLFLYDGSSTIELHQGRISSCLIDEDGRVAYITEDGDPEDGNGKEVFLYDGTRTIQLTANALRESGLQTNNNGQIIWKADGLYLYDNGTITQLSKKLRDFYLGGNGWVVWNASDGLDMEIYVYDGEKTTQLTHNLYDDDLPRINTRGDIIWQGHQGWLEGPAMHGSEVYFAKHRGHSNDPQNDPAAVFLEPEGYDIISVCNNIDIGNYAINATGQVVWKAFGGEGSGIHLYDGVTSTELTHNEKLKIGLTISDSGAVVWYEDGKIVLYDGAATQYFLEDGAFRCKAINDIGQLTWASNYEYYDSRSEFFVHDTETTALFTIDNHRAGPLEVNNKGQIVWAGSTYVNQYDYSEADIYFFDGSSVIRLSEDTYGDFEPKINDNGNVVWYGQTRYHDPESSDFDNSDYEIFFYDGSTVIRLTENGRADLNPRINSKNQVVWCGNDESDGEIYLYDGATVIQLTDNDLHDYAPSINDNGQVVWFGYDGIDYEIFLYDTRGTTQLTDNGYDDQYPLIGNNGSIVWTANSSDDGSSHDLYYAADSDRKTTDEKNGDGGCFISVATW